MAFEPTRLEAVLRRERLLVLSGLAAITLVAWAYLLHLFLQMQPTGSMDMDPDMPMSGMQAWGSVEPLLLFVDWGYAWVPVAGPVIGALLAAGAYSVVS